MALYFMGRLRCQGLRVLESNEGVQPKGYKNRDAYGIDIIFFGINGMPTAWNYWG